MKFYSNARSRRRSNFRFISHAAKLVAELSSNTPCTRLPVAATTTHYLCSHGWSSVPRVETKIPWSNLTRPRIESGCRRIVSLIIGVDRSLQGLWSFDDSRKKRRGWPQQNLSHEKSRCRGVTSACKLSNFTPLRSSRARRQQIKKEHTFLAD
jgi:hypothetical protein